MEIPCGATVTMLRVAVDAAEPLTVTDVVGPVVGEVNPQVISAVEDAGTRAQLRFTVPLNPCIPSTVIVEVAI